MHSLSQNQRAQRDAQRAEHAKAAREQQLRDDIWAMNVKWNAEPGEEEFDVED